jgi:hypothetical protein
MTFRGPACHVSVHRWPAGRLPHHGSFMQFAATLSLACQTAVMLVKSIALALLALVVLSATAHADPTDDQYLKLLASHGIQGDPGAMISEGRASCDALDQGRFGIGISPYGAAMLKIEADLTGAGLSSQQISQLVHDANQIYCPGKA